MKGPASESISPHDGMYNPDWPRAYSFWGKSGVLSIQRALDLTGVVPGRILDLPSGYGRVLRWIATAYPDARLTACDIDADAVGFCAREFAATPVVSSMEPEEIPLERYDVIWVGSLFTHLDAHLWPRFLGKLAAHLDGVMAFTTAGEHVAEKMRAGEHLGVDAEALLAAYDRTGFGYAAYPGQAYGLARAKQAWVLQMLEQLPLEVVDVTARGWAQRQDVYTVRPR
jgi:SAM-dependent methyltransferase